METAACRSKGYPLGNVARTDRVCVGVGYDVQRRNSGSRTCGVCTSTTAFLRWPGYESWFNPSRFFSHERSQRVASPSRCSVGGEVSSPGA